MNQLIFKKHPYAAEILLEHIACNMYLNNNNDDQLDEDDNIQKIVKFHFFA